MVSLGRSRNLLATRLSSWTNRGKAGSSEQLFPFWPRDRADDPRHVFLFTAPGSGLCKSGPLPYQATGAALKSDWRKSSFCRSSMQLQGKNYSCKPFRTSQGVRNPRQPLRMHSKHPQPAVRIEFFTLKSLGHWSLWDFFSIAYQAAVLKMVSLAAEPAWAVARWFSSLHPRPSASYPQHSKALKET